MALLVLGVQIIFYTRSFGDEYEGKRDAIKEVKNTLLVEEIDKLFELRGGTRRGGEPPEAGVNIFVDEGDEVRHFESLAEVRQLATEVEEWVGVIERGKSVIRKLGLSVIANGVIFGAIFTVIVSSGDMVLVSYIAEYVLGPALILLVLYVLKYFGLVRKIDKEIVGVMQRRTGMS